MSNSKYWEDRIAKNVWKTYNSLEEKNRELLEFYTDASKAIKEELYILAEKLSKDGSLSRSDMYKNNHLKKLEKRYEEIIKELGENVEEFASQNMQEGFEKVYSDVQISLAVPDFAPVDKKLMEKLLNEPWKGSNFSKRLWKNQKKLTVGLNGILTTGLQQGKTVTEMAVNLHNFMGMGFNDCHRLVRTETMHYLNESSKKGYKDAGVQKVQFCAAEDERTCEVCGAMHKKVYLIDEAPILPLHPNCRCTWLPVLENRGKHLEKSDESGIIELQRKGKNQREGLKFISDETFDKLTISTKKKGAIILRGAEVEEHLDKNGAAAAIVGDVLMFRKDVCISEVLEETHHFEQNLMKMNADKREPLRSILNEIEAKQYLLDNADKYSIPRKEVEITKKQLRSYKKQLREYQGGAE